MLAADGCSLCLSVCSLCLSCLQFVCGYHVSRHGFCACAGVLCCIARGTWRGATVLCVGENTITVLLGRRWVISRLLLGCRWAVQMGHQMGTYTKRLAKNRPPHTRGCAVVCVCLVGLPPPPSPWFSSTCAPEELRVNQANGLDRGQPGKDFTTSLRACHLCSLCLSRLQAVCGYHGIVGGCPLLVLRKDPEWWPGPNCPTFRCRKKQ